MATQIQLRRGSSLEWATTDPILAEGEIGIDLDLSAFKIGDGSHPWSELTFLAEGPEGAQGATGERGATGDSRFPSTRQVSPINGDVFAESGSAYIYLVDHWYQFNVAGPYFV